MKIYKKDFLDEKYVCEVFSENKSHFGVHFRIETKAFFDNTKFIRKLVSEIFDFYNLPKLWKGRFILIVDELNNNSIEHGSESGAPIHIEFSLHNMGEFWDLKFSCEDAGKLDGKTSLQDILNLQAKRKKDNFINHKSIRGRGLFMIVNSLVDELNFESSKLGGIKVEIKKKL